jgi:hypothetical protein
MRTTFFVRPLLGLAVLALFALPTGVLDILGWEYSSEGGSILTKIHPTTYLLGLLAICGFFAGRSPTERKEHARGIAAVYTVCAVSAVGLWILVARLGGGDIANISAPIVTFITPALLLPALFSFGTHERERLAATIRLLFVANSLVALVEQQVGHRFIPTFLDAFPNEWRSGALFGHPLSNAFLTGTMLLYLATAHNAGRLSQRLPELLLHSVAMFCFGGRASLIMLPIVLLIGSLIGNRRHAANSWSLAFTVLGFAIAICATPIPFVQSALQRFTADGGSAMTRLAAIRMMEGLDPSSLLFGIDLASRNFLMRINNTPLGIEISWLALTLTYGLIATAFLAVGLLVAFWGLSKNGDKSAPVMAFYFFLVTAMSLSIGSKTLMIAQAITLIYILASRPKRAGNGADLAPVSTEPSIGRR